MSSPPTSPSLGRPFHATRTWNLLIDFLKRNANIKKRRNLKMQCGECFTGMNAVDVLMTFSRTNSDLFSDKSINRTNIVRLCQSFMDSKIIEPAFDKKCLKFQDSSSALYLFPDEMPDFVLPRIKHSALRSIDGEIMNGIDQISISDPRHFATPRSNNLQIPSRNSRFPSFGGLTASSFKETFMRRMSSESEEEDAIFIQKPDRRSGRKLKRSSSLVGYVIKRSSSDSNLRKEYGSSASDTDQCENKDENHKGGMMKFGQRLSFRKKSINSGQQHPTMNTKIESNNNNKVTETHESSKNRDHAKPPIVLHKYTKFNDDDSNRKPGIQPHCFDPRRRSLAVKHECAKPPRSLRRMLSSPALSSRARHLRRSYNLHSEKNAQDTERKSSKPNLKQKRLENDCDEVYPSPPKVVKKEHPIKETPSRLVKASGYLSSFANRMSLKKRSHRNSEQSSSHVSQSCVIKNPLVGTGLKQPSVLEKKLSPQELNHVKRECIRVRLLQILDLSFVDCLITSPTSEKKEKDKFVWTNFSTSLKYSEVARSYAIDDDWIKSALVVLRYLPNGYDVLRKYAREPTHMKKLGLYGSISKYYKAFSKPLIDDSMNEITENISNMLESKPISKTLEVVQLFLHLLPESVFSELRDLITFLRHVSDHDEVAIGSGVTNETRVLQSFSKPLLSSSSFLQDRITFESSHSSFLLFLMQHADSAFSLPSGTEAAIRSNIQLAESGEVESPLLKSEITFCERITSEEFKHQCGAYTQMHLRHLSQHIMESDIARDKRKKMYLKKLKSSHSVHERTGPLKAVRKGSTSNFQNSTPGFIVKQRPLQAPLSDPLARRKNKSNAPIYI